jgi:hypothetical protein
VGLRFFCYYIGMLLGVAISVNVCTGISADSLACNWKKLGIAIGSGKHIGAVGVRKFSTSN